MQPGIRHATTLANSNTVGSSPYGIFIDSLDTIYVPTQNTSQIQVWTEGSVTPIPINTNGSHDQFGLFVTIFDDVYISSNVYAAHVDKWEMRSVSDILNVSYSYSCYGIFIDAKNTLYCSLSNHHQISIRSLNNNTNITSTALGNGSSGSESNMLSSPQGIFVDVNLTLYVADSNNSRIQRFDSGQKNGTTVAINDSSSLLVLNYPTGVVCDGKGYLFIVDSGNNRIIGQGPNGFRCVAGCSNTSGTGNDQLSRPTSMSFDSHGNIYVTDTGNNRVQKFELSMHICGKDDIGFHPTSGRDAYRSIRVVVTLSI